ncbi:EAL domain, c-di-GMP-specific phosphodiesterase class I (or its enzymatically inactive variant) [Allgaiera indica]|uniref:EAL domain, c-di-GMP-specific phosphodiesterase class I (Or its enzymatically inactive variant) n=2 Tax=Allgaiera indica TaxID=765699 RepID=A0A1H2QAT8_9RHOB|nr:EAL domain, c-di-GMP-specific phosphodiesterase class I (or its enzymatically inactive variant) [Allgaiera indica]
MAEAGKPGSDPASRDATIADSDAMIAETIIHGADSPLSCAVTERDRDVMQMVRRALKSGHACLAFQPVVHARDTARVAFQEGLIRLMDHTGRVIPAREFITVTETSELGRLIDTRALELGLAALQRFPALRLSINMSARSIGYPEWKAALTRAIKTDPTLAERLILEITESSAMLMPDLVSVFMRDLQRVGVSFALDDFGAGYTAIRHFKDFYFDILKIDGQFIRGVHADPDNQVLVQAMVSIARHFDMFSVAEFVEDQRDADFLARVGVDCLQGYLFGAPTTKPPFVARMDRRQLRA